MKRAKPLPSLVQEPIYDEPELPIYDDILSKTPNTSAVYSEARASIGIQQKDSAIATSRIASVPANVVKKSDTIVVKNVIYATAEIEIGRNANAILTTLNDAYGVVRNEVHSPLSGNYPKIPPKPDSRC